MLLQLGKLKSDKEYLSKQAGNKAQIQPHFVLNGQREGVWNQESDDVDSHGNHQELLGLDKLEVNDLSHSFTVVEFDLLFFIDHENVGKMVVVEVNMLVWLVTFNSFLDSSDLVSNNDFLEINTRVFDFDVLLVLDGCSSLLNGLIFVESLDVPSHVWVLVHDFLDDLLFRVVEVIERLFCMVVDLA